MKRARLVSFSLGSLAFLLMSAGLHGQDPGGQGVVTTGESAPPPSYGGCPPSEGAGAGPAPSGGPAPGPGGAPGGGATPGGGTTGGGRTGGVTGGRGNAGGGGLGGLLGGMGASGFGRKALPGKPYRPGEGKTRLPGSGKGAVSPDRVERTTVRWLGVDLPHAETERYGDQWLDVEALVKAEHRHQHAKPHLPTLVYFAKEWTGKGVKRELKFRKELWQDEAVGLATKCFNCYCISLDDIESKRHRDKYDHGKPWILILDADGKHLGKLSGWSMNAKKLQSRLAQVIKSTWRQDLRGLLKKEAAILADLDAAFFELDRLEHEHKRIRIALAEKKDDAQLKARLDVLKVSIAKVEQRRAKILAAEYKLFSFLAPPKIEKAKEPATAAR
jgi:hypothetical protein